jgi:anti-sigma regulatory factor (Ser/Thr protein kinase)
MVGRHLVLFVHPSARSLSELRAKVRDFVQARLSCEVCSDLLLALDEAVTNALVHAGGAQVVVHVGLHDDRVTATIRDGGGGFDAQRLVDTWPPGDDIEGGRGIYLATRLMDSVSIFAAGGTIVHMSRSMAGDADRSRPVCIWSTPSLVGFAHESGRVPF